jgi:ribosomal protein S18 acetylase RimI-like enzyme
MDREPVTIRRALPSEAEAVALLDAALHQEQVAMGWRGPDRGFASRIQRTRQRLGDPDVRYLVAEAGGALVGFVEISVRRADGPAAWDRSVKAVLRRVARRIVGNRRSPVVSGYVHAVYVAAGVRGGGVGRRLLTDAIAWARARGATLIDAHVIANNEPSRRLFASVGMHVETLLVALRTGDG